MTEDTVKAHYTTEALVERIKDAVTAAGGNGEAPKPEELKGVDEFHTGGLFATNDLLDQLDITPDTRVLDIGCGIGGTARHVALRTGATVRGFDLTDDYVASARVLSDLVGMGDKTRFEQGSALDMPVADESVDLALMFHVGMNIEDKTRLMAEAYRVLAPGGTFALFDVMKIGPGEILFPVPWAEEGHFSFVASPDTYLGAAETAGFEKTAERQRGQFALDFFEKVFAAIKEQGGPPPVGIHLLMRETGPTKIENYVTMVKAGTIAPVEMIFRKG